MNLFLQVIPLVLVVGMAVALVLLWRRERHNHLKLQRILQAIESTTDAIGIGDFEGGSLYHNRAHVALFGYTVEELNAVPGSGVLFADKVVAMKIISTVYAGRSWSGETEILTKDGRHIPCQVRADAIYDERGTPVGAFGVFRDITRERQLAEDAARASKLDSIGMMAGGIAHDFNNLLAVILGQAGLAQMEETLSADAKECLDEIVKVGLRARDLTQQLKSFARGETPAKKLVNLAPVVREAANLAVKNSKVTLIFEGGDLPEVMADESQILQVVNNLGLNGVQAMPNGGMLTVKTGVVERADAQAARLSEGRWVRVVVGDSGVGIPPENLARIFEPFFTTKKSGTGLGLATCFSIAAKHGGHLRVESTVGKGTTFTLYLPAFDSGAAEPKLQPANVVKSPA